MTLMRTAQLSQDVYLDRIVAILRQALRQTTCHVYLFGSRAEGRSRNASDFDIGVLAGGGRKPTARQGARTPGGIEYSVHRIRD